MQVYLNDRVVPAEEAKISVYDHGYLYGDGVYETLRAYEGSIFRLDEHLGRLFRSASLIGLDMKRSPEGIKAALREVMAANGLGDAYIRITVSRGTGPIGLDPELCPEPTFVIFAHDFKPYPDEYYTRGVPLFVAAVRRNSREALDPRIKSLNFLNNILAKIEAKKAGAYEALLLNADGHLTEGTISNVFFVRSGGTLCTPAMECGILDGITRTLVIDLANREGITVEEGAYRAADLHAADEVFITNTTMEVMPVSAVDGRPSRIGTIAGRLRALYQEEVREALSRS